MVVTRATRGFGSLLDFIDQLESSISIHVRLGGYILFEGHGNYLRLRLDNKRRNVEQNLGTVTCAFYAIFGNIWSLLAIHSPSTVHYTTGYVSDLAHARQDVSVPSWPHIHLFMHISGQCVDPCFSRGSGRETRSNQVRRR